MRNNLILFFFFYNFLQFFYDVLSKGIVAAKKNIYFIFEIKVYWRCKKFLVWAYTCI